MQVRKLPSMALLVKKMKALDAPAVDRAPEPLRGGCSALAPTGTGNSDPTNTRST
jgi:hypothetical protein